MNEIDSGRPRPVEGVGAATGKDLDVGGLEHALVLRASAGPSGGVEVVDLGADGEIAQPGDGVGCVPGGCVE